MGNPLPVTSTCRDTPSSVRIRMMQTPRFAAAEPLKYGIPLDIPDSSRTGGGQRMKTGDQVVQELPWRWGTQGMIFLVGGLGYLFDAWDVTLNGLLIPQVKAEWGLTVGEVAWVGTANLIGMAIGAFAWGAVADI